MNAIDILILNSFSAAFDLKYVIRHYEKLLLCIHISGIHCSKKDVFTANKQSALFLQSDIFIH